MGYGESERLIVPTKRGNPIPKGTLWREGGRRDYGTSGGKDDRDIELGVRLNETSEGSGAGEAVPRTQGLPRPEGT